MSNNKYLKAASWAAIAAELNLKSGKKTEHCFIRFIIFYYNKHFSTYCGSKLINK